VISYTETLRLGIQSLLSNKQRTFLTALGLLIGNASVIWVVTISLASQDYILNLIRGIGSNIVYASYSGGASTTADSATDFVKVADVEAVRQQLDGTVAAVSGVLLSQDRMRVEGREEDVSIIGADEYYAKVRNLKLLSGRFIDSGDIEFRNHVAMLTEKMAKRLFGSQEQAIGQHIRIQQLQFDVVGTFKESSSTFGQSELKEENAVIPVSVLRYFVRLERVDPLYVSALNADDVERVTRTVKTILESRHRPGARYEVANLKPILDTATAISYVLSAVLLIVSSIALLISGIGIMNIMLVTVKERTREIGVRLAIGASRRAVLLQFLTEAILISMIGGFAGIVLGVSLPFAVWFFAPEFAIPLQPVVVSIAVAFGVSLGVGLIFGMRPANQAAQMNPTEALRYE
jgi:putative ABC transport system permease protein